MNLMINVLRIGLYFLCIVTLTSPCRAQSNCKPWVSGTILGQDDFRGRPTAESTFGAGVQTSFYYSVTFYNGRIVLKTQTCLYKRASWLLMRPPSNRLLQHEQLHFDIAELHRRLFVHAILSTTMTRFNYQRKIRRTYRRYQNALTAFQRAYDDQTEHGADIERQLQWQEDVSQKLDSLGHAQNELAISFR